MQILFRGRNAAQELAKWERRPFAEGVAEGPGPRDRRDLYEMEVGKEAPGPPEKEGVHRRLEAAIRSYSIFPPHLVTGILRRAPVEVGDTVGILYHVPVGLDLFFAARVTECHDGLLKSPNGPCFRSGFTYRTLRGHPELGEETFAVDKDLETGIIRVSLRSWSRPGTPLARVFPMVVRRLQVHASHAALSHLQTVAARGTDC
jgi:hypothetical protein